MKSVIIFMVSLFFGAIIFNLVYRYITVKKIKLNYGKHKNFEYALINNMIYLLISSFSLLMFYLLYENDFFGYILAKVPYHKEILDSGLFTGCALVFVGFFIKIIYKICLKIIRHKVFLFEVEENEQTWIMIIGCFFLFVVGIESDDYIFAFSALSLIIARFFWVINNSFLNLKNEFDQFRKLPIYTIIFIVFILVTLIIMILFPKYLLQIIFGLIVGVLVGVILYVIIHKKNNQ